MYILSYNPYIYQIVIFHQELPLITPSHNLDTTLNAFTIDFKGVSGWESVTRRTEVGSPTLAQEARIFFLTNVKMMQIVFYAVN